MDPELFGAYLSAEYWVEETAAAFALKIGIQSQALLSLHAECGVDCSAFLTAYNPGSLMQSVSWNQKAQGRMEADLRRDGFELRQGFGKDPSGAWPGECSVLALGISREAAERSGRAYGQQAIVWTGLDAVPTLVVIG
jgi:hypothetical protein